MNYGPTRAVNNVSFKVGEGEIVGFLGPNGAGKTTVMRILTTSIYPTQGTAFLNGIDVTENPVLARKSLGYLPETPPLYSDMRVDDFIHFAGQARGLRGALLKQRKEWVMEACGLAPVWKHLIQEVSLGFRQRIGLAQALIHDPKVLILDEPTSGLDPIQIIGIRNLIRDLAKKKTILFSTHILQEASAVSNRIFIINKGRIVAEGTPEELKQQGRKEETFYVCLEAAKSEAENALSSLKSVRRVVCLKDSGDSPRFSLTVSSSLEAIRALNDLARQKGWVIKELSHAEESLEDVFLSVFKKSEKTKGEDMPHA